MSDATAKRGKRPPDATSSGARDGQVRVEKHLSYYEVFPPLLSQSEAAIPLDHRTAEALRSTLHGSVRPCPERELSQIVHDLIRLTAPVHMPSGEEPTEGTLGATEASTPDEHDSITIELAVRAVIRSVRDLFAPDEDPAEDPLEGIRDSIPDGLVLVMRDRWARDVIEELSRVRNEEIHFSVPLSVSGSWKDFDLKPSAGRITRLYGKPRREDPEFSDLVLEGSTRPVATIAAAVEEVNRAVLELAGLGIAVGLLSYTEGRRKALPAPVPFELTLTGRLARLAGGADLAVHKCIEELDFESSRLVRHLSSGDAAFSYSELDLRRAGSEEGAGEDSLRKAAEVLMPVFRGDSGRGEELRNAGRQCVRAIMDPDEGSAVATALVCLEAVLLDRRSTSERSGGLAEAVAYFIGGTAAVRGKLRKLMKDLYEIRSEFTHTGRIKDGADPNARMKAVFIAQQVLSKEVREIFQTHAEDGP